MAFVVESVEYRFFRNIDHRVLDLDNHLTVLVGSNAVGKTNCMEGIQLLATGESFRKAPAHDLIQVGSGQEHSQISMVAKSDKRDLNVLYDIFPSKKLLTINGKRRPNNEGKSVIPAVLFCPDDLLVIKGSAAGRRDLFDSFGRQFSAAYDRAYRDYTRSVYQRNAALRMFAAGDRSAEDMVRAWTGSLINAGSALFVYRMALLARLDPLVTRIYGELSGGEVVLMEYESRVLRTLRGMGEGTPYGSLHHTVEKPQVVEVLEKLAGECWQDELRREQTMFGPHLDDVVFFIEGKNARQFGSQGQQRSLMLAIKLAQVQLIVDLEGSYPLFLLDDVMSELDEQRRGRLSDLVQHGMQTVVTTTSLDYFKKEEIREAKVVSIVGPRG